MCHEKGAFVVGRNAPMCTQAVFMAHFAGRREIGMKFLMRAASVDPKSTQHTPLITQKKKNCVRPQTDIIRLVSSKLVLRGASRRPGRLFLPICWKEHFKKRTQNTQHTPLIRSNTVLVTCRSRVICKKVASRSGTIGAQSEN